MQEAIIKMQALGRMPDESADSPPEAVVDAWQTLLEEIETPISKEEAEILVTLFPEEDLFELGWSMLHILETVLSQHIISAQEYRTLIQKCVSAEWRETLELRLNNWEKKEKEHE